MVIMGSRPYWRINLYRLPVRSSWPVVGSGQDAIKKEEGSEMKLYPQAWDYIIEHGIATIDKVVGPYPTQYKSYFPTRYLCHFDDDPALLVERNIWEKDIEF